jgi:hypothetical protein
MKRRGVSGVVFAFLVLAALAGAAPAARLASNVYTGIAQGGVDRWRDRGKVSDSSYSFSNDTYRVRIDFTFTVSPEGELKGTGTGQYTSLTWHLSGRNGSRGKFDCMIPVQGKPFNVNVFSAPGHQAPIYQLTIYTGDAAEHNDDYNCGADYHGYATDSQYIKESLDRVLMNIKFDGTHPVIPILTHDEQTGLSTSSSYRRTHDEWSLSIAPPGQTPTPPPPVPPQGPSNKPPVGGGPGLPGGDSPAGPSGDNTYACTIRGTNGNDVLNGTPGPDVICGFGGNDHINGGGGDDIIYGGLGNDTITGGSGSDSIHGNGGNDRIFGRDGQLDLIAGDAGIDTATVDKGRDTVRGVEIITR